MHYLPLIGINLAMLFIRPERNEKETPMNPTADRYFDWAEIAATQARKSDDVNLRRRQMRRSRQYLDLAMAELEKGARGRALRALKAVSL
jgi:hypothetical protein